MKPPDATSATSMPSAPADGQAAGAIPDNRITIRQLAGATRRGWQRWIPGLAMLRDYRASWLAHDVAAGLVLTTILVPVGIAYATASGLPGIYGLYATIVPLVAYAIFGPSRILVLGPDSSLAAIILAITLPLSGGDPLRAATLAAGMAIVSGLVCIVAGIARLGFVTDLLSKPIRYGYMNGIALAVLVSQAPKLFGFSMEHDGPIIAVYKIGTALLEGEANLVSTLIGLSTLAIILLLRRFPAVPGILIAVVAATLVVAVFELDTTAGVAVLGALPQGLPVPAIPWMAAGDIMHIIIGGFTVAMVSFADTSVLSRAYATRSGKYVDPSQEMIGLGVANLATGFFQGFPVSSSSSRTPVADAAGARTQVTGVVGALCVAALLVVAPNLLEDLPQCALGAVVISSAIGLIEIPDLMRIRQMERWEFRLSVGCLFGVAILGVIPGIGLAIAAAVVEFLWSVWRPHFAVLGRADNVKGYHDISRYPQARQIPGLVLFRWDAPLFFANVEFFQQRVLEAVISSPTPVRWLVVAAEPVTRLDVTASDVVAALDQTLYDAGIELVFAEMKDPVKDKLKRFGLFKQLGEEAFFPTVGAAVKKYVDTHDVPWEDWQDREA